MAFDAAMKTSFSDAKAVLERGGTYITLDWPIHEVLRGALDRDAKVVIGTARKNPKDLRYLIGLLEDRTIRPVIDRCYPLEQTAEAHCYVEAGHKRGNVVISVHRENGPESGTTAAPADETQHQPPRPSCAADDIDDFVLEVLVDGRDRGVEGRAGRRRPVV